MQWCTGKNSWKWENKQRTDKNHCGEGKISLDVPSAGEHTISFSLREDGFEMDKWLMTKNASYSPTGAGPAESTTKGGSTALRLDAGNPNGMRAFKVENPLANTYYKIDGRNIPNNAPQKLAEGLYILRRD